MELIHELLGYERIKIVQREDMLRLSLDSMLVADFVDTSKVSGKIIDLGTGNAPIPLFLTLKTNSPIFAVDIQEDACKLARKSVEINGLENQITVINENIKDIYKKVGRDGADAGSCRWRRAQHDSAADGFDTEPQKRQSWSQG